MKLDHINIKAPEALLTEEKNFFCDVLGFKEGPRPGLTSIGFWLYANDEPLIHLSNYPNECDKTVPTYFDHVAFAAENLLAMKAKLDEANVEFESMYSDIRDVTQLFFRSPTGTRIELSFYGENDSSGPENTN